MAGKVEGDRLQGLMCPLCLDIFSKATLLHCGHTFCFNCLEAYGEKHRHLDHMVCPVCRACTALGQTRVADLPPNYLARELEKNFHLVRDNVSFNFCSEHEKVYNDIFCEVCQAFICLNCFMNSHGGHAIKKKEVLEGDFEDKEKVLIQQSDVRKEQIEEVIRNAEQQRKSIHSHISMLESKIRGEFAKKIAILQKNETYLLESLDKHRIESKKTLDNWIGQNRQLIDNIDSSISVIEQKTTRFVDFETLKAYRMLCSTLENLLIEDIDQDSVRDLNQRIERLRFCPADGTLLALGDIYLQGRATKGNNVQVEENSRDHSLDENDTFLRHECLGAEASLSVEEDQHVTSRPNKEIEIPRSRAVIPIPVGVRTYTLNILRKVDLPGYMRGMAALSKNAVVVGYGLNRNGADRFSVYGDKKPFMKGKVGQVWDITFLADGRSVVSHGAQACKVYDVSNTYTGLQYTRKEGNNYFSLCSDRTGNIYAVNDNPEIYIFHGTNTNPQRVVPTGNSKPEHICVTRSGVIITNTCCITPSRVTTYDSGGHDGSSIAAADNYEYIYAAVDSQDKVLIARVRERSTTFKLALYGLLGTRLVEEKTFAPIKLPRQIKSKWCYMVSLTPNMIAFATLDHHLYFIELLM